jgi:hypothetical protein
MNHDAAQPRQEAAFRMFTVLGIALQLVAQPDTEGQP